MGQKDRADGILIATQPDLYTGPRTDALMPSAARHTQNGTFVAIYGQEYSTISSGNHVNVFDVPNADDGAQGRVQTIARHGSIYGGIPTATSL